MEVAHTVVAARKDCETQLGDGVVLSRRSHGSTHGAFHTIGATDVELVGVFGQGPQSLGLNLFIIMSSMPLSYSIVHDFLLPICKALRIRAEERV